MKKNEFNWFPSCCSLRNSYCSFICIRSHKSNHVLQFLQLWRNCLYHSYYWCLMLLPSFMRSWTLCNCDRKLVMPGKDNPWLSQPGSQLHLFPCLSAEYCLINIYSLSLYCFCPRKWRQRNVWIKYRYSITDAGKTVPPLH